RTPKKAMLPILAAVGGMIAPALVYLAIERHGPGAKAWSVPMATDIAFVVGFLSLLGKRVPYNLKIALLTLAIADDIGAIFVIAAVFTQSIAHEYLLASLGFYGLVFVLNYLGVRRILPYLIMGFAMWYCLLRSGIHPTIAGVLLGLAAPSTRLISTQPLRRFLEGYKEKLDVEGDEVDRENLRAVAREASSPMERLQIDLHAWVAFLIMPLFAFANAGVAVQLSALESTTAWAVIIGLVVGKPLGIFCMTWVGTAFRWVALPEGVSQRVFFAGSCLAGIGFTMSIFIATLALEDEVLAFAKVGTLVGSALSACIGLYLLHRFLDRREIQVAIPAPASITE
ncbi:MAG: Na+/H+ antiporter NhaA, partial [Proteobacteria bacterium]